MNEWGLCSGSRGLARQRWFGIALATLALWRGRVRVVDGVIVFGTGVLAACITARLGLHSSFAMPFRRPRRARTHHR
jgi:hypothetical protein